MIILNVDTNALETPFDDLHNLPSDVVRHTCTEKTYVKVVFPLNPLLLSPYK